MRFSDLFEKRGAPILRSETLNAERKAVEIYLTERELQALYEMPLTGKKFGHKSMSRNPLVFGSFTRMHVVEKVGSGVPRMRELMKDAGLP